MINDKDYEYECSLPRREEEIIKPGDVTDGSPKSMARDIIGMLISVIKKPNVGQ